MSESQYNKFNALFLEFQLLIFAFIQSLVHNTGIAEELTQETFLRLWKWMKEREEEIKDPKPWLYSVASNVVRDHWRRINTRKQVKETWDEMKGTEMTISLKECEKDELKKAIRQLPAELHQVLFLKFFMGFNYEEIAKEIGKSKSTVGQLIADGITKLRKMMGAEEGTSGSPTLKSN